MSACASDVSRKLVVVASVGPRLQPLDLGVHALPAQLWALPKAVESPFQLGLPSPPPFVTNRVDHAPRRHTSPLMQPLQEAGHQSTHDYRAASPHLKHWYIYDRFVSLLREELNHTSARGLARAVLEVGAGHGGYTEPVLAFGFSVTATEMSRPCLARLTERYGSNPQFSAVLDAEGTLDVVGDETFSVVLCVSVLHHIPDYLAFLERAVDEHLAPGGTLLTIQDPLWYPSLSRADLFLSRLAYFSWRLTRGNYLEGARTLLRRFRSVLDEGNPRDMVEYHVVRCGVDHDAIAAVLSARFETLSVIPYWSTQSALWQRVGGVLARKNTFAVVARGFLG